MAYYTGTVTDMLGVRQALIDACVIEGWAWNSSTEVLSNGPLFLRLRVVSGYLTLLGRTSGTGGDAPDVVRVGDVGAFPVVFPVTYEVFVFATEVFLVINYAGDHYQWAAFGRSTVAGLPGSGMWVGASQGPVESDNVDTPINIQSSQGGNQGNGRLFSMALFWTTQFGDARWSLSNDHWVHSDLDGEGWQMAAGTSVQVVGIRDSDPLLDLLPNTWNSESVLLPIRAYKMRPQSKISLVADIEHARYTRLDSYEPGQVITVGPDRWKVFPWYRKNSAARAGGRGIDHTGTFGWAIRYEGP